MGVRGDDRGLALGIVSFFAMLVIAALLYIIFDPALSQVLTTASGQAQTQTGQNQLDLIEQLWGGILVFVTALALVFIISRSVFESRGGGF